jgi:acyl dehydratase
MPIDPARALALVMPPLEFDVERGRLRQFAAAVGETDPLYVDVTVARAAGHPDLPALPTFLFAVEMETAFPFAYLEQLDVDLCLVLHGEQSFEYHAPVHAGDSLVCHRRIVEAYAKTPTMDFLVKRSEYLRGGELVAVAEGLTVSRSRIAA